MSLFNFDRNKTVEKKGSDLGKTSEKLNEIKKAGLPASEAGFQYQQGELKRVIRNEPTEEAIGTGPLGSANGPGTIAP